MIKVNLDADMLKVLRRIPLKIIVMKYRCPGPTELTTSQLIKRSAMQGMKL